MQLDVFSDFERVDVDEIFICVAYPLPEDNNLFFLVSSDFIQLVPKFFRLLMKFRA